MRGPPTEAAPKPPPLSLLSLLFTCFGQRPGTGSILVQIPGRGMHPRAPRRAPRWLSKSEVEIPGSWELATQRVLWFQLPASKRKKKREKERNLGLATCVSYTPSCAHVCTQKCGSSRPPPSPVPGRGQYLEVAVFSQSIACQISSPSGNLAVSTSLESVWKF